MVEVRNPRIQTFPFFPLTLRSGCSSLSKIAQIAYKSIYKSAGTLRTSPGPSTLRNSPGRLQTTVFLDSMGQRTPPDKSFQDLGIHGKAFLSVFATPRPLSGLFGPGSETLCCCSLGLFSCEGSWQSDWSSDWSKDRERGEKPPTASSSSIDFENPPPILLLETLLVSSSSSRRSSAETALAILLLPLSSKLLERASVSSSSLSSNSP